MIIDLLIELAQKSAEETPPVTLTMLGGDVFTDATIIDFDYSRQEFSFVCTETDIESEILLNENDEPINATYTEIGQRLIRYIWRADNVVGIGATALNLSEDLLISTQQPQSDPD